MKISDFIEKWGNFDKLNDLQEINDKLVSKRDELIEKSKEYNFVSSKTKTILLIIGAIIGVSLFLGVSLISTTVVSQIISTTILGTCVTIFLSSVGINLYDEKQKVDGSKIRNELSIVNKELNDNNKELSLAKKVCYQIGNDKKNIDKLISLGILNNEKSILEFESSLLAGLEEENSLSSLLYLAQNERLAKKISKISLRDINELKKICLMIDDELKQYLSNNELIRHRRSERYNITDEKQAHR